MRLIDADALMLKFNDWWYSSFGQEETEQSLTIKEAMKAIEDASTVDAVKATMPWTNPDGTETMLDEVSYEIGYSQGQKDTKRQGYWVRFYGDHICMGLRPKWDCCSECGMVGTPTRFCSNCGARMDGKT